MFYVVLDKKRKGILGKKGQFSAFNIDSSSRKDVDGNWWTLELVSNSNNSYAPKTFGKTRSKMAKGMDEVKELRFSQLN